MQTEFIASLAKEETEAECFGFSFVTYRHAEKLVISRSVVAKWDNNVVIPDISSLIKLSRIFNVTLDMIDEYERI